MTDTDKQVEVVREQLELWRCHQNYKGDECCEGFEQALGALSSLERTLKEQGQELVLARDRDASYRKAVVDAHYPERLSSLLAQIADLEATKVMLACYAENTRLRAVAEVARETLAVLEGMLDEDVWPPERLAAWLNRLTFLLRSALSQPSEEEG